MTTKLSDLQVIHLPERDGATGFVRFATPADLVAALIAEGGEIREAITHAQYFPHAVYCVRIGKPGRYLVFPIPVEAEAP